MEHEPDPGSLLESQFAAAAAARISHLTSMLAAAAAAQPEYLRAQLMLQALITNFHHCHQSTAECFTAVYGDSGATFWEIECSEPVQARQFVRLLTVTREQDQRGNPGQPDQEERVMDMALGRALVDLYQADPANLAIFAGDRSSLAAARYGSDLRRELKVHIRPAAAAILAMPKRRHLVPRSLAEFIEGPTPAAAAEAVAGSAEQTEIVAEVTENLLEDSRQDRATKFMQRLFKENYDASLRPPKIEKDAYPACRIAVTGVTLVEMEEAMRKVPKEHKRTRGGRDRGPLK